jgi:Protein phosphatase 2C
VNVEIATEAAPGHENEDFAGANSHGIVLIDGAGLSDVDDGGCIHGVAWYARQLGDAVLSELEAIAGEGVDLRQVLKNAISNVADQHSDTCDLSHPGTPSATIVIVHIAGDVLSYLVLADSTLLVATRQGIQVITDHREARVGASLRAAMDTAIGGTAEHDAARRDYVAALRAHRNAPDGFWVVAADPGAAAEAIVGDIPLDQVDAVTVMSDGATRVVDRFGLATWADVLRTLAASGPSELIRLNREAERSDPACRRWPRGKVFDDATAALLVRRSS